MISHRIAKPALRTGVGVCRQLPWPSLLRGS